MEFIISKYGSFKDSSPEILKSGLQAGETAVWWMKDKTGELAERPIKMVDATATRALESMEEKKTQLKSQWEASNQQLQSRMNDVTGELRKRSDGFQYQCLESIHNLMDYVEDSLEVVLLPPSQDSLKYAADEASAYMTMKRMMDLTYRLNAGAVKYTVDSVRRAGEPWVLCLHKHLHPGQVRVRLSIIRAEAFNTGSDSDDDEEEDCDDYLTNDDLTGIDRTIIATTRYSYSTGQRITRPVFDKVAAAKYLAGRVVAYPGKVVSQVRSLTMKDVQINGLRATSMAFDALGQRSDRLKKSQMFHNIIVWTARKEKQLLGVQQ